MESVANNASGYNLLQLQSGSSPTDKFVVSSTGAVTTGIWNGTAVGTQYGGTGQNWQPAAQGSLPYFNGTGTMNTLAPTTSNYVLTTQGAAANPQWKDVTTLVSGWNQLLGTRNRNNLSRQYHYGFTSWK